VSREWVSEIEISRSPARSAARPWSAQRLDHGLLGGEAGGEVAAGTSPIGGVGDLVRGEEPLGQTGATLEGTLDPLDLDQVDADAGSHHDYFSPTTRRKRARSPSLPEPTARKSSEFRYCLALWKSGSSSAPRFSASSKIGLKER